MKNLIILLMLSAIFLTSCSGAAVGPVIPTASDAGEKVGTSESARLWNWGMFQMHIPADHQSISMIPDRNADRHYNVKMLLEQSPCDNCIWVSKFVNNGDGTVSISIKIRHPYPGQPYYTGFDVRGVLYLTTNYHLYGSLGNFKIPAHCSGDPELLNADGFTRAYDMSFPTEGIQPIFLYQPDGDLGGSLSKDDISGPGTPIWPFICYYSNEERRYFSCTSVVERTYNLALPEGEWVFGYSVDACWAPPTNTPVMNVVDDFPINANTLHDYRIDASISGPLVGEEPSLLKMRIYKHFPELLEHTSAGDCDAVQLDGKIVHHWNPDPISETEEYLEYHFEIKNVLHRPPGFFFFFLFSGYDSIDYDFFKNLDPNFDWGLKPFASTFYQVFWVEVADG